MLATAFRRSMPEAHYMSRAQLDLVHPVTELGLDLRRVRNAAGLPLFMFRSAVKDLGAWVLAGITFDSQERARREMMLCYFAGYATRRRRESRALEPTATRRWLLRSLGLHPRLRSASHTLRPLPCASR